MKAAATASKAAALRTRLHHYATLLVAELAFLLVYPFFVGSSTHDVLGRVLGLVVFVAAIYAVLGRGRVTWMALLVGLPSIVVHIFNVAGRMRGLETFGLVSGLVFLIFVSTVLVTTIISDPSVTADTLAGAVSAYLLIGITFGMAYTLIDRLAPGSFKDTILPGKQFSQGEFTFFSFITLTTVGYGDIVPWGPHARAVAMIESVLGIMYPAVMIGRLVALHGRKRDG